MWRIAGLIVLSALAGCGSRPPVPVVDRSTPLAVEGARGGSGAASSSSRENIYVVKKGDNLYRVAMAYGVTPRDILAWNNLTDSAKLEIGQELRVAPPDGGVEVRPISAPAPIVVMGDGSTATGNAPVGVIGSAAPATGALVREPRGGKIPYSENALAQMRAMEGGQPPVRPAEQMNPTPTPALATTSVPTSASTDGVEWTWPVAGKVIRGFGKNGGGEISRGIDIAGRKGEPIQVAAGGKVTFVGSLDKYGDFVVVRHDADYLSVYAHTSKILVKRDQMVTKGQKIAEVGSSGTDQPKLHFEIRQKSEPVDPLKLLPARQ
jgi:lipoprotein NlpD